MRLLRPSLRFSIYSCILVVPILILLALPDFASAAIQAVSRWSDLQAPLTQADDDQSTINLPLIFLGDAGQNAGEPTASPDPGDDRNEELPTGQVQPPNTVILDVAPAGEGLVFISPFELYYDIDQPVSLDALPVKGWQFSHWTGDLNGNTNPVTILLDQDKSVTAHFIPMAEPSPTSEESATSTATATPNSALTPLATAPPATNTPTSTSTQPPTNTPVDVATAMPTFTPTSTATETPTDIPTNTPTITPTELPTEMPTDIPTIDPTAVPTETLIPDLTPVLTATVILPTNTPLPTETPEPPTETPTPLIPLVASNDLAILLEDEDAIIDVTANDVGLEPLLLASTGAASNGTVAVAGNLVRYTPNLDFFGTDTFTYTVGNPFGQLATATVLVTVLPINDPPVLVDQSATTNAGEAVTIIVTGTDPDDNALAFYMVDPPNGGTVESLQDNDPMGLTLNYIPDEGFSGADSFVLQAVDASGLFAEATISVTVNAPPPAGNTAEFSPVASPPQIDGGVDQVWNTASANFIRNLVRGEATTNDDIGGNFRGLYDDENIYLLITVRDDILVNDSGEVFWRDDVIELFTDGNLSQGSSYDGVDDMQLFFRWNDDVVESGVFSIGVPPGLDWAMIDTANGYRLEVAIPRSQIGISESNLQFGIDVHVSDDDDGGDIRESKIAWSASIDTTHEDPSTMGTAQFVGQLSVTNQ